MTNNKLWSLNDSLFAGASDSRAAQIGYAVVNKQYGGAPAARGGSGTNSIEAYVDKSDLEHRGRSRTRTRPVGTGSARSTSRSATDRHHDGRSSAPAGAGKAHGGARSSEVPPAKRRAHPTSRSRSKSSASVARTRSGTHYRQPSVSSSGYESDASSAADD